MQEINMYLVSVSFIKYSIRLCTCLSIAVAVTEHNEDKCIDIISK